MRSITQSLAVVALLALAGCGTTQPSSVTPSSASAPVVPSASVAATVLASATAAPAPTPSATSAPTPSPTLAAAYVEGAPYAPVLDPADFVAVVDNPYLPWIVGTTWTYRGGKERNVVTVLPETKVVLGVTATVVHDRVFTGNELTEDTFDWYAQDTDGNVWYLGEDTKELENGKVTSREGTWEAGVGGAQPGIVMPADPAPGLTYRQEYKPGEAEDVARVRQLGATVTVRAGTFNDVLVTEEWTRLDPTILEHKSYAPGVGVVLEEVVKGSTEHNELLSVTKP
jgi:hypothetical protein